jgi:hypothetical protein
MIKVVSINQIDKLVGDMARIEITKEMLETWFRLLEISHQFHNP